MRKSTTCDVFCRLPHGLIIIGQETVIIGMDGAHSERLLLEHGFNANVPRGRIERWLTQNKNLACVRRGDIRILDGDRLAVDSSTTRK
ncbi:MAG: hypothetical protein ACREXP_14700 [Steroidobacteraceae bacterium]